MNSNSEMTGKGASRRAALCDQRQSSYSVWEIAESDSAADRPDTKTGENEENDSGGFLEEGSACQILSKHNWKQLRDPKCQQQRSGVDMCQEGQILHVTPRCVNSHKQPESG